jgi:hypothetical protein
MKQEPKLPTQTIKTKWDFTPFELAEIQAMQARIYSNGHEGDCCELENYEGEDGYDN